MGTRRGIFLIGVLLMAVLVAMFVSAALALSPAGLQRNLHQSRRGAAERALQTGIDYAVSRIRASSGTWRAEPNYRHSTPDLQVEEGEGQVLGWVRDGSHWSRFRYSFNWLDGSAGADGLEDASHPWSDFSGLSYNNILGRSQRPIPVQGQHPLNLPPHCLLLSAEGQCGGVLGGSPPSGFATPPSSVRAQVILQLSHPEFQGFDSVASASGDLHFKVQSGQQVTFEATGSSQARLRSKASLQVVESEGAGGRLISRQGEVRTPLQGQNTGTTLLGPQVSRRQESPGDAFYSITWDSAPQPGAGAISLEAGVYEVSGVNGQPKLLRYPMTFAEYQAHKLAGDLAGGVEVSPDSSVQLGQFQRADGTMGVEVRFTQDVRVSDPNGLGLALVPTQGAFTEENAPSGQGGQQGGGSTVEATVYLADLASKIHNEISATPDVLNGDMAYFYNHGISSDFRDLFLAYSGGDQNFNLGVASYQINFGASKIQTLNNYGNQFDNLAGSYEFKAGALELAQYFWSNLGGDANRLNAMQEFVDAAVPDGFGEGTPPDVGFGVDLGGGSDPPSANQDLSSKDLRIRLEGDSPEGGITFFSEGNVVLAGAVEGRGGAVVAGGDISLLGNGVDLQVSPEGANSISLYSRGNILIDGFAYAQDGSRYRNVALKGVVYSWGSITIRVGQQDSTLPWGDFHLTGAMVARGGDPAQPQVPGASSHIRLLARSSQLTFDPAYLVNLLENPVTPQSSLLTRAYFER